MKQSRVGRPKGENVENANRRRKQLMDAAIESIVEHGLSATTLATVARASGLSQGTAVFYFKSKESLLRETFRHLTEENEVFWNAALSDAGSDPVDKVVALAFAAIDPRVMTPRNLKLWNAFWNAGSPNAGLSEMTAGYEANRLGMLLSLCEAAEDRIEGAGWTPKIVAHTLETMAEGVWIRVYYSPKFITVEESRLAMATVLSAIFPSRADDIMTLGS